MEVQPVILSNVVYDIKTRTFYSETPPLYPYKVFETPMQFCPPIDPPVEDTLTISRPTYVMGHFHSCFGHAYVDECIPILSVLHEYDSTLLRARGFQLFILKDMFSDIAPECTGFLKEWEDKTINYEAGTMNHSYEHFHKVFSDVPILFEKRPPPQRYIRFATLLYGGNSKNQRCIHNSSKRYPGRQTGPTLVTDEQILRWVQMGKDAFCNYLQIPPTPSTSTSSPRILLLARKGTRSFNEYSLELLSYITETEPIFFESLSFDRQIKHFQEATTIIAAHGSGLCHLLWCRPGTHVIEIFQTNDPRKPIFESYCEVLGLRYSRIECSSEDLPCDEEISIPPDTFSEIKAILTRR